MTRCISTWAIAFSLLSCARGAAIDDLVARAGKQVESFGRYYSAVTCTESVVQLKLGERGRILSERRATYDYLLLLGIEGGDLFVEESRIEKGTREKGKASFLATTGFPALTLIFHPQFRSSYEFRELPQEGTLQPVEFTHLPGHRSPSALVLEGREYPLEWKGVAWIEPGTGAIVRIRAGLKSAMEELGLLRLEAEVRYSPVRFPGLDEDYWLPQSAIIDASSKRQTWRNVHDFKSYRRFNVETRVSTEGVR